ncbi:MAG: 50S ribosomal protein L15 [Armatimonadetes bacterium]|nr:50S ribosomal protein L15 [Armatimonadota bacterium]
MNLGELSRASGKLKKSKRIGRGHGSGNGLYAGRGVKGQNSRGHGVRPGFEGGQNPLYMRLPKLRGTSNKSHNIGIFRADHSALNVSQLERLEAGTVVTPELVQQLGWVKKMGKKGLKILGQGELTKALTVHCHAVSESAKAKIEAAGGSVEVIVG